MSLVTVPEFRDWSGANLPASASDALIQSVLDEAEAVPAPAEPKRRTSKGR